MFYSTVFSSFRFLELFRPVKKNFTDILKKKNKFKKSANSDLRKTRINSLKRKGTFLSISGFLSAVLLFKTFPGIAEIISALTALNKN